MAVGAFKESSESLPGVAMGGSRWAVFLVLGDCK